MIKHSPVDSSCLSRKERSFLKSMVSIHSGNTNENRQLAFARRASIGPLNEATRNESPRVLRRVLTASAPLPLLPFATDSPPRLQDDAQQAHHHQSVKSRSRGFRKDYKLGDPSRSAAHMLTAETFAMASNLEAFDFAFVKRTNGQWTYSILAHRSGCADEECMIFVLDRKGSTKSIKRDLWASLIRCVAPQEDTMTDIPQFITVINTSDDSSLFSMGSC